MCLGKMGIFILFCKLLTIINYFNLFAKKKTEETSENNRKYCKENKCIFPVKL